LPAAAILITITLVYFHAGLNNEQGCLVGATLEQEWLRGVIFTVIAAGVLALGVAVWQYFDADRQLQDNIAHQVRASGGEVSPQTQAEAQGLVAADIARRELVNQQYTAMMIGGGGLVAIALGWILLDLRRSRLSPRTSAAKEKSEPTSAGTQ
jgi:hypothetical protein